LRVEFPLKTDGEYPKDVGTVIETFETPGIHFVLTLAPIGQLTSSAFARSRGQGARQAEGL